MRLYTDILPDVLVTHTRLPRSLVDVTLRRLKEADRIPKGFRHAPPLSPRDVARIVLGLAAMSPTAAVDLERAVGRQALAYGDTVAETAEGALVALVEGCAGIRTPSYDLVSGTIVVGQTVPSLEIRSRRPDSAPVVIRFGPYADHAHSTFTIPIPSIRAIACELLKDHNV